MHHLWQRGQSVCLHRGHRWDQSLSRTRSCTWVGWDLQRTASNYSVFQPAGKVSNDNKMLLWNHSGHLGRRARFFECSRPDGCCQRCNEDSCHCYLRWRWDSAVCRRNQGHLSLQQLHDCSKVCWHAVLQPTKKCCLLNEFLRNEAQTHKSMQQ